MCPGGIIAPASTSNGELVVNGWSPSKRNNPYANSGIVVNIEETDWQEFEKHGPLAAMYFQSAIEQKAFATGGGNFKAPAQRMTDFVNKKSQLPCLPVLMFRDSVPPAVPEVFPAHAGQDSAKGVSGIRKENERIFYAGGDCRCHRIQNFIARSYSKGR